MRRRNSSWSKIRRRWRLARYQVHRTRLRDQPGVGVVNDDETEMKCCCRDPITGFYRNGFCRTGPEDLGLHTVCVKVTREFLDFSVLDGNDLVTPHPEWGFPGLKPGDKWCVCVTRWKSALDHNRAAPVDLEATHASALEFVTLEELKAHALAQA